MGSLVGTIKDTVDEINKGKMAGSLGVLKIKTFRPFPANDILKTVMATKQVAVLEKAVSLGATDGPLTLDVKAALKNKAKTKVQGFTVGLGGRDITQKLITHIVKEVEKKGDNMMFVG